MRFALALLVALVTTPSVAQQPLCGPFDTIVESLAKNYGERPVALGISSDGKGSVEIFLNPSTRTFSVIRRFAAQRMACLVADGEEFEALPIDQPDASQEGL
mgnify:CR=1 FL=1